MDDFIEKLPGYKQRALAGDVEAQLTLANAYLYGEAGVVDGKESMRWCRMALQAGHPQAKVFYGGYHFSGLGVPKDHKIAFRWWNEAAQDGNANGQAMAAWALSQGVGVDRNDKLAAELWLKAATQGVASAQISIARCYEKGLGVERDLNAAAFWHLIGFRNNKKLAGNEVDRLYELLPPGKAEEISRSVDDYIRTHPECIRKREKTER